MDTIELDCPSCDESLEIDAGFAGGVCRCSNCGALMTVPSDPDIEQAESLTRRARPDAPSGSASQAVAQVDSASLSAQFDDQSEPTWEGEPADANAATAEIPPTRAPDISKRLTTELSPTSEQPSPEEAAPEQPAPGEAAPPPSSRSTPKRPDAPEQKLRQKSRPTPRPKPKPAAAPEPEIQAELDDEVYVTASGKTVHVRRGMPVPTARKRDKVIRASILLLFFGLVGGLVLIVAVAWAMLQGGNTTDPDDATAIDVRGYDPDRNPFSSPQPTVLGLPLEESVIVAIDASRSSGRWLPLVADSAALTARKIEDDTAYQVHFWSEGGDNVFPPNLNSLIGEDRQRMQAFVADQAPRGTGDPIPTLQVALEKKPRQIVLITGQTMPPSTQQAVIDLFAEQSAVQLDLILIAGAAPQLEAFVDERGEAATRAMPLLVLQKWYREADEYFQAEDADDAPAFQGMPGFDNPPTSDATTDDTPAQ